MTKTHILPGDQISHIQSMVAKRGLTNRANVSYLYVKKSFKTQHGRIPVAPAILAAIGHRFIANKLINKQTLKMLRGSEAMRVGTRNQRPLFLLFKFLEIIF